jgi:hypothetical protein
MLLWGILLSWSVAFYHVCIGPQAAIIVGDMKLIVDCWWRESKNASTAQLYNLTTDIVSALSLSTRL